MAHCPYFNVSEFLETKTRFPGIKALVSRNSSSLFFLYSPLLVAAQAVTPPPGFNITSLGINGSGCPPGSTYYVLSA
ncbi:hypothetical protein CPB84DRAFT_1784953, partial [Gymnopilus junonius]